MVKHSKFLRILAVTLTLALLLVAIPASAVLAATTIDVENTEGTESTNPYYGEAIGEIGDEVSISGEGTGGTELHICLSNQNAEIDDDIDSDVTTYEWLADPMVNTLFDTYSTDVTIPDELNDGDDDLDELYGGTYYFYVTQGTSKNIVAKAEFYLAGIADATLDTDEGPVGSEVEINGDGFAPEENLEVYFDSEDITDDYVLEGDVETDEDGEFTMLVEIPEEEYGEHDLTVLGVQSNAEVTFTFFIEPEIILEPASGAAGDEITVRGTGFDGRSYVDIYIGSTFLATTDRTNSNGSFLSITITIPEGLDVGTYYIYAEDEDDDDIMASASFSVTAPALNPVIEIDPGSATVDSEFEIDGTDFTPSDTVTIYFDGASMGTATTLSDGSLSATFNVPESVAGEHTILVEDGEGFEATATITVESKITLDIDEGPGGTEVTATGTGFAGNSDLSIDFDGDSVDIDSGDEDTDSHGSFELSFLVPGVTAGTYDVTIEDEDSNDAEASFAVVVASASITPTSGATGTEITVTGAHFLPGAAVNISYDGASVATTSVGSNGAVSATFDAPLSTTGTHTVTVSDGISSSTATFTITAEAAMTPTSGNVGSTITVNGTGFGASKAITIKYDGTAVTLTTVITTLANGSFSGTFTAPASSGGSHAVSISDGSTTKTFTFTMETTAPAIPQQLLPYGASKPDQPVTFDWEDVTDPSAPVTYSLQIATDASYATLVLDKSGLTNSEYTLTEAEEMDSVTSDNPYYWRIRSTDAAGNNSNWGPNGTFYVGTTWPGWLMWLWIGLGALVLGIFFFWLGRRIAFSSY